MYQTVLCHIVSTLFLCFLLICYLYILLHFCLCTGMPRHRDMYQTHSMLLLMVTTFYLKKVPHKATHWPWQCMPLALLMMCLQEGQHRTCVYGGTVWYRGPHLSYNPNPCKTLLVVKPGTSPQQTSTSMALVSTSLPRDIDT